MTQVTNKQYNKTRYANPLEERIADAIRNGRPLSGKDGLLTPIIKSALEAALFGEMDAHLESSKQISCNRRNGNNIKQVKSSYGNFELATPRDRNSSFEPEIVKKRQTVLTDEIDHKIMKLFTLGMSYNDISDNMEEIYGSNR